jgi:hypothetical protein
MSKLYTCIECGQDRQERDMTWLAWGKTTIPVCSSCRVLMGGDDCKGLLQLTPEWWKRERR